MIGVIADDVTGATDVAAALSRAGLRTMLALTADAGEALADVDAVVIGLKTRSIDPQDAVAESLTALTALQGMGADRFYLKYCSTFDSRADGNIGPVTEALAAHLGAEAVVTTPAAPVHGRTVYCGHLFVGHALLNDTHMREHPITPMLDSSVPRLLATQTTWPVSTLALAVVRAGTVQIGVEIAQAVAAGRAHIVADATDEADLDALAGAVHHMPLSAGSAGLIGAIARLLPARDRVASAPPPGRTALIAGSCSRRTLEQIAVFQDEGGSALQLIAAPDDSADDMAARALEWWDAQHGEASALMYSSSAPENRDAAGEGLGELYEKAAGLIAVGLAERGIQRMLIAGGETSGEVIRALGTRTALVGEEVAVGAPWIHDTGNDLHLVLKSGNFGEADMFVGVTRSGGRR